MNVYPFIIHLGPLEITGYGIMMMLGFLVGGWLITLELRRRQLRDKEGELRGLLGREPDAERLNMVAEVYLEVAGMDSADVLSELAGGG